MKRSISILALAAVAALAIPAVSSAAQGQPGTEASKIKTHKPCKAKRGKACKFVKRVKGPRSGKDALNGVNGRDGANGANGKDGARGERGPQGIPGLDGKDGRNGLNGVSGYEVRTYDYIQGIGHREGYPGAPAGYSGVGSGGVATVACSSDSKVAVTGGWWVRNGASDVMSDNMSALSNGAGVVASFPGRMDWTTNTPKPNRNDGWIVRFNDKPATDVTLYVVCVNAA